jgi:hypothetical protein
MMPEMSAVPLEEMLGCVPGKFERPSVGRPETGVGLVVVVLTGTGLITPSVMRKACPGALEPQ